MHQIVLVDDASNHTDITTTLPLYIKSRLPSKVVAFNLKIIHVHMKMNTYIMYYMIKIHSRLKWF